MLQGGEGANKGLKVERGLEKLKSLSAPSISKGEKPLDFKIELEEYGEILQTAFYIFTPIKNANYLNYSHKNILSTRLLTL